MCQNISSGYCLMLTFMDMVMYILYFAGREVVYCQPGKQSLNLSSGVAECIGKRDDAAIYNAFRAGGE